MSTSPNNPSANPPRRLDPQTGEPKPPRAPVLNEASADHAPQAQGAPPPSPIPGHPVLAWHRTSMRTVVVLLPIAAVLGVIVGVVLSALKISDMPWLIALVGGCAGLAASMPRKIAAGANWLQYRGRTVDTYALTKIEVKPYPLGPLIRLWDDDRNGIALLASDLQANRPLWDYVYNGIRLSVAGGAEINNKSLATLRLDTHVGSASNAHGSTNGADGVQP